MIVARGVFILFCLALTPCEAMAVTTCTIAEKLACGRASGCKRIPVSVVIRLDVQNQTYSRCDAKGCDDYPSQFAPSGIFTVIDVPGRGMVAKMLGDGSEFVEVVTQGTGVIVSFGKCN